MQTTPAATRAAGAAGKGAAAESEVDQYLTFSLGSELFAVGILAIKEIIQFGQVTGVPMMPPYIRGVINLRGAVVPVIDLTARFNKGASQIGRRSCIVIIEIETSEERQVIGLLVDSVSAVLDIPASEVEPVPAFGAGIRTEFIRGMARLNDKFVIILDVTRTFCMPELESGEWAAEAAGQAAEAGAKPVEAAAAGA